MGGERLVEALARSRDGRRRLRRLPVLPAPQALDRRRRGLGGGDAAAERRPHASPGRGGLPPRAAAVEPSGGSLRRPDDRPLPGGLPPVPPGPGLRALAPPLRRRAARSRPAAHRGRAGAPSRGPVHRPRRIGVGGDPHLRDRRPVGGAGGGRPRGVRPAGGAPRRPRPAAHRGAGTLRPATPGPGGLARPLLATAGEPAGRLLARRDADADRHGLPGAGGVRAADRPGGGGAPGPARAGLAPGSAAGPPPGDRPRPAGAAGAGRAAPRHPGLPGRPPLRPGALLLPLAVLGALGLGYLLSRLPRPLAIAAAGLVLAASVLKPGTIAAYGEGAPHGTLSEQAAGFLRSEVGGTPEVQVFVSPDFQVMAFHYYDAPNLRFPPGDDWTCRGFPDLLEAARDAGADTAWVAHFDCVPAEYLPPGARVAERRPFGPLRLDRVSLEGGSAPGWSGAPGSPPAVRTTPGPPGSGRSSAPPPPAGRAGGPGS